MSQQANMTTVWDNSKRSKTSICHVKNTERHNISTLKGYTIPVNVMDIEPETATFVGETFGRQENVDTANLNSISKDNVKTLFSTEYVSHIKPEVHEYGWPHLYPEGKGGYDKLFAEENDYFSFDEWCQLRLGGTCGRARWDPSYIFYLYVTRTL